MPETDQTQENIRKQYRLFLNGVEAPESNGTGFLGRYDAGEIEAGESQPDIKAFEKEIEDGKVDSSTLKGLEKINEFLKTLTSKEDGMKAVAKWCELQNGLSPADAILKRDLFITGWVNLDKKVSEYPEKATEKGNESRQASESALGGIDTHPLREAFQENAQALTDHPVDTMWNFGKKALKFVGNNPVGTTAVAAAFAGLMMMKQHPIVGSLVMMAALALLGSAMNENGHAQHTARHEHDNTPNDPQEKVYRGVQVNSPIELNRPAGGPVRLAFDVTSHPGHR